MLRIGISQRVEDLPDRGERRDCLDQAWTQLLLRCDFLPVPLPNRVGDVGTYLDELGIGGVILSGGNDLSHLPAPRNAAPERDQFEGELVEACSERRLPILGVCRGLEFLVVHHGGRLQPIEGHIAVRHSLVVTEGMPLGDRTEVNSFHDYGVFESGLGPNLKAAALAMDGSVEAVVHRQLPHWGIMWHPERAPHANEDAKLIQYFFREYT